MCKKILLTGARGFVGSYFLTNYKDIFKIKTFSFIKDDIDELKLNGIDAIVHLSALVHQMNGAREDEYEKVNVIQSLDLAKRAKKYGVKQFIFMSTIKVYGEESNTTYDEKTKTNPQDDYSKSKLKAELELMRLEDKNFKVSIVRTPVVYGKQVKGNILSLINLIKRVYILPLGGIQNKRSFVYIGNLCNVIYEIIKQEKKGIFLACDDEVLSTTDFVKYLSYGMGKKNLLIKLPFFEIMLKYFKPNFYQRFYGSLCINNNWTKEELKLRNPFSIKQGVKEIFKDSNE